MDLIPYTRADAWLTEALETDPEVMAELGGPWKLEDIAGIHERRLEAIAGGAWYFKIVPEPRGPIVGAVTLWPSSHEDRTISETGWMMLREHQGKGYASAAVRQLLARADEDGRWGDIHAFPGATNAASNAICRKFEFTLLGEELTDYGDRELRVYHWVRRAPASADGQ